MNAFAALVTLILRGWNFFVRFRGTITHNFQFMKKLSNIEAEVKKGVAYIKNIYEARNEHI